MNQTYRPLLGLLAPSPWTALAASIGSALVIVTRPQDLAKLAVYGTGPPSALSGALVMAQAGAESLLKVVAALGAALVLVCLLLAVTLRSPTTGARVRQCLRLLANAPVMMLLPTWLVVLGNSETAAMVFLIYCMTVMLGFTVFDDSAGGAQLARRVIESLPLDGRRRLSLVLETVVATMRQSIFQILMLGLPLALAAELINNQSGLGFLATNAFSNGDYAQLAVIAAAYVIAFCVLWLIWAFILALSLRNPVTTELMGDT